METLPALEERRPALRASMGPRFCKRGNRRAQGAQADPVLASMGPRFCKRGNALRVRGTPTTFVLQWGHAFVSVETCVKVLARDGAHASMGPRFCKRGNLPGIAEPEAFLIASMGPRFCKRGNSISHRGASIPPFLAPAARSGATSAYFGRLGRDFAGHFPAQRASSPL